MPGRGYVCGGNSSLINMLLILIARNSMIRHVCITSDGHLRLPQLLPRKIVSSAV